MLVGDAIGDHVETAYSRVGLMAALFMYVAISVSFCLLHGVAVSDAISCNGFSACVAMFWM